MSEVSRRGLLAGGAAAGVAAATAGLATAGPAAAQSDPSTPTGEPSAAHTAAHVVPSAVPGAQSVTVLGQEAFAFTAGSADPEHLIIDGSSAGVWSAGSRIAVHFPIPAGARVHRVDCFGSSNKAIAWFLSSTGVEGTVTHASFASFAADDLVVSHVPEDELIVPANRRLGLYILGADTASSIFTSATAWFTPPSQNLIVNTPTVRAYDSRAGRAPLAVTKGLIGNGATRAIDLTVGGGVPAGATAALVNVTLVNTSTEGFLALFEGGTEWPGNSSINFDRANQIIANTTVVPVSAEGTIGVRASGTAHFLIDVIGYYV